MIFDEEGNIFDIVEVQKTNNKSNNRFVCISLWALYKW